jgi:hypothetical protein
MIGAAGGEPHRPSLASLQLRSDRFGRQEFALVDLVLGSKVKEGMPANLCNGEFLDSISAENARICLAHSFHHREAVSDPCLRRLAFVPFNR